MSAAKKTTPPGDKSGGSHAGAAAAKCPCPPDFTVSAPCRIVKVKGKLLIAARELPGMCAGSYKWSASSANVKLLNVNSPNVTVEGVTPGGAKDSETLTVVRSANGCPDITKTVQLTVARVKFAALPDQRWGYDDFDTPADSDDDHISIKTSDNTTVKVTIEGGLVGTDFDFVCDSAVICKPDAPEGSASFNLKLNGGKTNKGTTFLRAKVKCPSKESFAKLAVHVYKEVLVDVVVGKFFDNTSAGTTLRFPNADFAAFAPTITAKAKDAVVKYAISNFDAANKPTNVAFDKDSNGCLSFDIVGSGGKEFAAIKKAMTGTGKKIRVAIVKDMKSYYYLSKAAKVGDTKLVMNGTVFTFSGAHPLGSGAGQEVVTVTGVTGNTITVNPALTKAHAIGEGIEWPAAGWSSDPILIIEGTASEDILKWTVFHETGHRKLTLADIDPDDTTIMFFSQAWTDHRLRYCPRKKKYEAGKENQWEKIPRT